MSLQVYQISTQIAVYKVLLDEISKKNSQDMNDEQIKQKILSREQEFIKLEESKNYSQLIINLYQLIHEVENDHKSKYSIIILISSKIKSLEDTKLRYTLFAQLVDLICNDKQEGIQIKLSFLGLINGTSTNGLSQELSIDILNKMLTLAQSQSQMLLMKQIFVHVQSLFSLWKLNEEQQRVVLQDMVIKIGNELLLQGVKRDLIIKYIQTINKQDIAQKEINTIQSFLVELINHNQFVSEIIEIKDTIALQYVNQNKLEIGQILAFYTTGDFKGYLNFKKSHPQALSNLKIKAENFEQVLKVLYISSFAHKGQTITFSDFAKNLEIDISEVELWVIQAIQDDLIEAKINQQNQTIFIINNKRKIFSDNEWDQLSEQLDKTISKLSDYVKKI